MSFGGVTTNPPPVAPGYPERPRLLDRRDPPHPGRQPRPTMWKAYSGRPIWEVSRQSADMVFPVYEASNGLFGHVSGQVDPRFVTDKVRMLQQGLELAGISAKSDGQNPRLSGRLRSDRGTHRARDIDQQHDLVHCVPIRRLHGGGCLAGWSGRGLAGVDLSRLAVGHQRTCPRALGNTGDLKGAGPRREGSI